MRAPHKGPLPYEGTGGVLALQGGFGAHLRWLGDDAVEVRSRADLEGVDFLVLPGGESTTQHKLIELGGLLAPLESFVRSGKPVFATCAGLILCARYGWLDVTVRRNAYGRQVDSFEALDDSGTRRLVFIRAPRIERVGPRVEVLASFGSEPVLVRQGNVTGACYHPELCDLPSSRASPSTTPERRLRAAS
jgi:pyridoxal 5'-phosphate synthase pdxT subunit